MNQAIQQKLKTLPDKAGVYIMYDDTGNILYVGKARVLKNRVRQYFHNTPKPVKVSAMLTHVTDFSYIIVPNEADAFSLENTLIKKHKPPFNILLKDDKQYPYIKVNLRADFPRFVLTRKVEKDKYTYFGPIVSGGKRLLDILHLLFPLANCSYNLSKLPKNFRPCLNYHLHSCSAPCTNVITKEEYSLIVKDAVAFLSGDYKDAEKIIYDKMLVESEKQNYETAMTYRYYLDVIKRFSQKSVVAVGKLLNVDCFAVCFTEKSTVINHLTVQGGKVNLSENFALTDGALDAVSTMESFLCEYASKRLLQREVLVNVECDCATLQNLLSEITGIKHVVSVPQKGEKKQLVLIAEENAADYLDKAQTESEKRYAETVGALLQLKKQLNLKYIPKRMECYDISNISGVDKVASMVVFENGEPQNQKYRRFIIKTVEGANDFASMKEALLRRFARLNDEIFGDKPDLIVIDGGLGQLNYAKQAMEEAGVQIQMVSLAKKFELVYTLDNCEPIALMRNSPAQRLLVNIRDEAHRFAITSFRKMHGKAALRSVLREIEGVGEKRQIALQKHFQTLDNLKEATIEQLVEVDGINRAVAENVYKYFHAE